MISFPPSSIAYTVELWSPGIWRAFYDALWKGYVASGSNVEITSWWRSVTSNRNAGGSPNSQHLIGTAVDVQPATQRVADAFRSAGFIAVLDRDHVHLQVWRARVVRDVGLLAAVGV